jgi:hypothetical protein
MAKHLLLLIVIACCLNGTLACAQTGNDDRQVWFSPNMGSTDFLQLFTRPDQWADARAKIDVFKFYTGHVASGGQSCKGTVRGGSNYIENLIEAKAFSRLKKWKVDIAIESLYPFPVRSAGNPPKIMTGKEAVAYAAMISKELIHNVQSNGGTVRYLVMDEPIRKWYPQVSCLRSRGKKPAGMYDTLGKLADDVAEYIKRMKSEHPSVQIGQVELYPEVGVDQFKEWIVELTKRDVSLPFLHLDVHQGRVDSYRSFGMHIDVAQDLKALKSFFEARKVAFGVIFTDLTWQHYKPGNYNDKIYYDNAIKWTRRVKAAMGEPDHSIFQSWAIVFTKRTYMKIPQEERIREFEKRTQKIPVNLPENDPSVFSHTRLLIEGLGILRGE